jgi:hypothetical protein
VSRAPRRCQRMDTRLSRARKRETEE